MRMTYINCFCFSCKYNRRIWKSSREYTLVLDTTAAATLFLFFESMIRILMCFQVEIIEKVKGITISNG